MRHVRSILYALVLAPAVWILCGVAFTEDLTGRARDATGGVETVTAILLLVLAGAAYAILVFAPISPLGPALAGLVFLGVAVWALLAPDSYAGVWPAGVTKEGFDLSRPGYALAALLAVPMLATALSARRWARYEPPELPLIGTLGRARGKAAVAGTPVAEQPTAVLPDSGRAAETMAVPAAGVAKDDEPTEPVAKDDEPTEPLARNGEPAQAVAEEPTQAVDREGEPTQMVAADGSTAAATPDEPTEVVAHAEPAGKVETAGTAENDETAERDDERTQTVAQAETPEAAAQDETTEALAPEPSAGATRVKEAEDEEPTQAVTSEDRTAEAPAAEASADEPATAAVTASEPEPSTADVAATEPEPVAAEVAEPGPVPAEVAAPEPVTAEVAAADDEERTQVIRLGTGPDAPTHPIDHGGATQVIGPGEKTQVIFRREPSDPTTREQVARNRAEKEQAARDRAAQERARQAFRDRAAQDRARQAFEERAARAAREVGESTQRITVHADDDGGRTQVLPPGGGTVEPPGDRTQVLRFPTPDQRTTEARESIVGQERPDPGADPTTRLRVPAPSGNDTHVGEDTTAEVAPAPRPRSVLDLERPADEADDDTRRLPNQRRPVDADAEEPTTRL